MKANSKVLIVLLLLIIAYLLGRSEHQWFGNDSIGADESAHWVMRLDSSRPNAEGLVIKGSGAGTNCPLLMIRDFQNAPIAWMAPHGGLTVTDNIRVRSGVFDDDGVSLRRWTDGTDLTGDGDFS